jgi:CRP-like cAMP-binding protein
MSDALSKPTLPTFSWIGQLKPDDRDLLSSYGEFFPAYPGTVIIEEGAMQTSVFVVISGLLEVRAKQDDETEPLLARVGPGETLGEISLFDPGPASATVRAEEFSQLWRIADSDLIVFMEENPGAGNVLLRTLATILAQRLRQVSPHAFGISTYAVIDSPDLARETPPVESAAAAATTPIAPPVDLPGRKKISDTQAIPNPDTPTPLPDSPPPQATGAPKKRVSTNTQPVPDPDDLGPLTL